MGKRKIEKEELFGLLIGHGWIIRSKSYQLTDYTQFHRSQVRNILSLVTSGFISAPESSNTIEGEPNCLVAVGYFRFAVADAPSS
jgi:hypothetical protein